MILNWRLCSLFFGGIRRVVVVTLKMEAWLSVKFPKIKYMNCYLHILWVLFLI